MYLTIDWGNTRCKLGLFDAQGVLIRHWIRSKLGASWLNKQFKRYEIRACILSSVRRGLKRLRAFLLKSCAYFLYLSASVRVPIQNEYATPKTLGRDRLAVVAAAWARFPNRPCLVINAGTCITYDYLDAAGVYRGGSIGLGLRMRFRALHEFTARLPLIEPRLDCSQTWGGDTETAIRAGVQQGFLHEVRGVMASYAVEQKDLALIFTGGDGAFLTKHLGLDSAYEPHWVLYGLYQILIYNVQDFSH